MLHHITAISKDAQTTSNFYVSVLGLRLVKVTVNQDDVGTYHLYFGDKFGKPGTVLTFFPWGDLPQGHEGSGLAAKVSFSVPHNSFDFWRARLDSFKINHKTEKRFGKELISFVDPDGLSLEITHADIISDWTPVIAKEYAISGFHGISLLLDDEKETADLLTKYLGYTLVGNEGNVHRFFSKGTIVDIHVDPHALFGISGLGTIHHIAFRAKDAQEQLDLQQKLAHAGFHPTPPIERYYFKSVYFRSPGGVLFEIATDGPGFTVDEGVESLGSKLVLPPQIEPMREKIEKVLPKFIFPR